MPLPRCPPGLGPLLLLKDTFCLERDVLVISVPHTPQLLGKAEDKHPSLSRVAQGPRGREFLGRQGLNLQYQRLNTLLGVTTRLS